MGPQIRAVIAFIVGVGVLAILANDAATVRVVAEYRTQTATGRMIAESGWVLTDTGKIPAIRLDWRLLLPSGSDETVLFARRSDSPDTWKAEPKHIGAVVCSLLVIGEPDRTPQVEIVNGDGPLPVAEIVEADRVLAVPTTGTGEPYGTWAPACATSGRGAENRIFVTELFLPDPERDVGTVRVETGARQEGKTVTTTVEIVIDAALSDGVEVRLPGQGSFVARAEGRCLLVVISDGGGYTAFRNGTVEIPDVPESRFVGINWFGVEERETDGRTVLVYTNGGADCSFGTTR